MPAIQLKIQLQYVDDGLTQETELSMLRVLTNQLSNFVFRQIPHTRHAGDLVSCSSDTDMRIETAGAGGNQINGYI